MKSTIQKPKSELINHKSEFLLLLVFVMAIVTAPVYAVQVQDLARLKGAESSKLTGIGLVMGLKGTGDGGKHKAAREQLASVFAKLTGSQLSAADLRNSKNVAVVSVSVELPRTGAWEGDKVDVHIASAGESKSLEGGRLLLMPLTDPYGKRVYVFAEGDVVIENPDEPNKGVITRGAQLTRNYLPNYFDKFGRITLVIDQEYATWPMASNLAGVINGLISFDGPNLARVIDQKSIVIDVPMYERADPAVFISRILTAQISPEFIAIGSRVVINEKTGTIVMSSDVQITPALISQAGLTITQVNPPLPAMPQNPQVTEQRFIAMDPQSRGGARLADLLKAFNQLQIDTRDQIEIIKKMHDGGMLHAQLIIK